MNTPLAEIVLVSKDVPRLAAFYKDIFMLTPEKEPDENWAWFRLSGEDTDPASITRLAITTGPLLYQEHSPNSEAPWGTIHFALRMDEDRAAKIMDRARNAGHEVLGPQRFDWMRATAHYIYDPDGNLPELWVPDARTRNTSLQAPD